MRSTTVLLLILLALGAPVYSNAQMIIAGKVYDSKEGLPMGAVNIIAKGNSGVATTSDFDGTYSIEVPSNTEYLVFSLVGYETQEVFVDQRTEIDVNLVQDMKLLSAVEIVGSRNLTRTKVTTVSPVDVVPLREVTNNMGQLDINQVLHYIVPSFNANRQSTADGADHVDPASLRGLGPDQVLVLINGKRRHSSSLVNIYGTRGRGSVGTDLSTIPVASIDRIEILRDGAAAQYGSDAIAGVINIVLKNTKNALEGYTGYGMYTKGDGKNFQLALHDGVRLGKTGFLSGTFETVNRQYTNRSPEGSGMRIGDSKLNNHVLFLNTNIPLKRTMEIYGFGGFNKRQGESTGFFRQPDNLARNVPYIYPDGFLPEIHSDITDGSGSIGIRGILKNWSWDLNNTYGTDKFLFRIENSLNASMGKKSPTEFDAGGFRYSQNNLTFDVSRNFPKKLIKNIFEAWNVALGLEYRQERYQIFAGDETSWYDYRPTYPDTAIISEYGDTTWINFAAGSQVFPGFRPTNAVTEHRTNFAAYFDTEIDITKQFAVALAARGEAYSDFGNALVGKASMRYAPIEQLALRGTVSTGFRAPSLQQLYYNTIATNFVGGVGVDVGIYRNDSPIAQALGIPQLDQEQSLSYTLGITSAPLDKLTITADAYSIDVNDRIVLTGDFGQEDTAITTILQAQGVGLVRFFTNAIDTRTYGVDLVSAYNLRIQEATLQLQLAANYNKTQVRNINTSGLLEGREDTYFSPRERSILETGNPQYKVGLGAHYVSKHLVASLRNTLFGKVTILGYSGTPNIYTPRVTTDASIAYRFSNSIMITLGGSNLFNVIPTKQSPDDTETGGYWDNVQMNFNGSYYFARLNYGLY
jgi:iron complex outermembrane receptor protein